MGRTRGEKDTYLEENLFPSSRHCDEEMLRVWAYVGETAEWRVSERSVMIVMMLEDVSRGTWWW